MGLETEVEIIKGFFSDQNTNLAQIYSEAQKRSRNPLNLGTIAGELRKFPVDRQEKLIEAFLQLHSGLASEYTYPAARLFAETNTLPLRKPEHSIEELRQLAIQSLMASEPAAGNEIASPHVLVIDGIKVIEKITQDIIGEDTIQRKMDNLIQETAENLGDNVRNFVHSLDDVYSISLISDGVMPDLLKQTGWSYEDSQYTRYRRDPKMKGQYLRDDISILRSYWRSMVGFAAGWETLRPHLEKEGISEEILLKYLWMLQGPV